jgi:HlyD family secretion protein
MIFLRDARSLAFAALLPLSGALHAAEPVGVACQGRILPASRVLRLAAYSETGAPVIAKLSVEEGAEVKAGDTVAELAALPAAKARIAAAEADAQSARLAVRSGGIATRAALTDAGQEIVAAEAALAAAKLGNSRKRLTDAQLRELSLALAAKEAEVARIKDSRPEFLARADKSVAAAVAAAQSAYGDARTVADAETERARAARDLALKDFDARLAGETDAIGILKARLEQGRDLNSLPQTLDEELAAAANRLGSAKTRLIQTNDRAEADADRARAEVLAAEARVAQAKALADIAIIKAPISGKILRVHARAGEAVGAEGVAEMGDLSKIVVVAEVAAADLPRTAVGKKAEIRVPGIEKPVTGVVVRVSPLIGANALSEENPAAFKDLRVAPVEIAVDEPAALAGLIRAQVTVRIAP